MIKAIVFDCFGVLATEAWLPFKAKYFGHDPELMDKVTELSWQADRGMMSRDEATQVIAKLAGITTAEAIRQIDRNVPDEKLFGYLTELRNNYKLGLLSNIASNRLRHIFSDEQLNMFDAIALSFEHGFIKPQKEAFETVAEQLGVKVEECVFTDDQQRNVEGAHAAGMTAVLYHDATQFEKELSAILAS